MPKDVGAGWEKIVLQLTKTTSALASGTDQHGPVEGNTFYEHVMCFRRGSCMFLWGVHALAAVVKWVHTWSLSSILTLARWI